MIKKQDLQQIARGFLMGGADIIPGVSGGTVALILGIYERLVTALSHFDLTYVQCVRKGNWDAAGKHIDIRFLMTLLCGVALGILSLATLMHNLLEQHRQHTHAVFFGLIVASSVLVAKMNNRWSAGSIGSLLAAGLFAFLLAGALKADPPQGPAYVFLCGMIAICAMILPGISGAFILIILGMYDNITGMLRKVIHGEITFEIVMTIGVFAVGCLIGLLSFSKVLRWLLEKHRSLTLAALCGFMIGSLQTIWPYKLDRDPTIIEFKFKEFENIWPDWGQGNTWVSLVLLVAAIGFVVLLDRLARGGGDLMEQLEHDGDASGQGE